jgi:hypothetical protein
MAINVNNVYQTVLLILNKEQRGYMTPDEFNKTATQVQLDIFEQYFDDLNQQLRVQQADYDYTDRQMSIDEKISTFKCIGDCVYSGGRFNLPTTDLITGAGVVYNDNYEIIQQWDGTQGNFSFYKLGTVVYIGGGTYPVEIQRLQRDDFYEIQKSELTMPSTNFPTYLYESGSLNIAPGGVTGITSDVQANFIRRPVNVVWEYSVGGLGQYNYNSGASYDFELLPEEQTNVILRILQYSGIIIRDPQIVQAAASEIQQNEINKKS